MAKAVREERTAGGEKAARAKLLAAWNPLRAALGPAVGKADGEAPIRRDGESRKANVSMPDQVEAAALSGLRACEEMAREDSSIKFAMTAGAIAAQALGELASMGFFKEALDALDAWSKEDWVLDPSAALMRLCKEAPRREPAPWRAEWDPERKMRELAGLSAWEAKIWSGSSSEHFFYLQWARQQEWPKALARLAQACAKGSGAERSACALLIRKAALKGGFAPGHLPGLGAALAKELAPLARGRLAREFWDELAWESKVALACDAGGRLGEVAFAMAAREVEGREGEEGQEMGRWLCAAAWRSMDQKAIMRAKEAFGDREERWLFEGLDNALATPNWQAMVQESLARASWAKGPLLAAKLARKDPADASRIWLGEEVSWARAFQALRSSICGRELQGEVLKAAPGARVRL